MSQLAKILGYLDREDISIIVMQTGRALSVFTGGEFRPLSKNPVTLQHIEAYIADTPLAPLLPKEDTNGAPQTLQLFDKSYVVRFARRGAAIQLRIEASWKSAPRTTGDSQVGLLPKEDSQVSPPPAAPRGSSPQVAPPSEPRASPRLASPSPPSPYETSSKFRAAHSAVTRPVDPEALMTGAAENIPGLTMPRAPQLSPTPAPPRAQPQRPAAALVPGSITSLVVEARARKASDLHLSPERPALMRTAGELLPVGDVLTAPDVEKMLSSVLNSEQKTVLERRGYVDMALEIDGGGRVRANISRHRLGWKGSFRLVMHPTPTLESLGLPKELGRVTTYHQGLIVIAGPNGHGKTSTLAALIDMINASKHHHILTVEEPVEFIHARKKSVVSQREVGLHTRTFASALKASLREDPDVIVIGELRDRETVEIALTAAETGHLVMATMSTPSAGKTIDRLIDLFPPEDQPQVRGTLAGSLKFVVAQRLLPSVSGDEFAAAVELLTGVPALWALIRENKLFQLPSLQQRGRAFGMIRFEDSLVELVRAGRVSEEVALRNAENKKDFLAALHPQQAPAAPAPQAPSAATNAAAAATNAAKGLRDRMGGLFGKKE